MANRSNDERTFVPAPPRTPPLSPLRKAARTARAHPRWSTLAVVIVLAGAGIGSYFAVSSGDSSAAATTTTTTETVATGTIRQSVSASGTLAPALDETLNFNASGVVTAVNVTQGQTVKKGQRLASIDSASLAATVAQNEATVADNQAKVDDDETNSATAAQLAADQAALVAAQNQLASARTALAGANLTSPIDGVVASVDLTVGQSVSGSSSGSGSGSGSGGSGTGGSSTGSSSTTSTSSGSIEVISTSSWIVNATVDATSVGLIKSGNQAQLTVTGATTTVYGTISSIAVLSSSTSGSASYPVVIAVTGTPTGLHDGAAVTATLIYKQLSDVIVVPTGAIHRNTAGSYVDKIVNGKVVQTTVQVGITSGAEVQVTSGLAAGDKIQIQRATTTRTGTGGSTTTGSNRGGTGNFGGGTGNFPGGGTGNFGGGGNFGGRVGG
jgi:multidrug efflux pump subunit AcrA (membrane-fusion protein)